MGDAAIKETNRRRTPPRALRERIIRIKESICRFSTFASFVKASGWRRWRLERIGIED